MRGTNRAEALPRKSAVQAELDSKTREKVDALPPIRKGETFEQYRSRLAAQREDCSP